ncbi:hypothetical protein [Arcticibacter svalbardensis]|uniref:hypothetical protein n=1 Tax=Arcticibacter svalbardensis TaxID=1288027 RepID=UPI001267CE4E|nr:hypothetical protein [Arcticibacter svalbardensis]
MVNGQGIVYREGYRNMIRFCLLLLLLPFSTMALDIKKIRLEFYEAVDNKGVAENFYARMKKDQGISPVCLAYYGSAQTLMAKHAWNPYHKLAYLKSGMIDLGRAVALSPDNLEIRFLRFSIEHYIPAFLGMSKNLPEDKAKIVELIGKQGYGSVDQRLLKDMVDFFGYSKRFTPQELGILRGAVQHE